MAPSHNIKWRDLQFQILGSFISNDSSILVPSVIVQGYKSVGKTLVVKQFLDDVAIKKTIVNCDEFLTQKLLLQKCLHRIRQDSGVDLSKYHQKFMYKGLEAARASVLCETFSQFLIALEQFVQETNYQDPHVLVLDRFDECLDQTNDLFRSFIKLREHSLVKNLTVIFITSHEDPREIAPFVVPHVYFTPYTQEQINDILSEQYPREITQGLVDKSKWQTFSRLVVDLLHDYTGTDISLLKDICDKLWPDFCKKLMYDKSTDFLKLLRALRDEIFQDDIITNSTVTNASSDNDDANMKASSLGDLPYHSKFILIASYLASYTEVKQDMQLFSRVKTGNKKAKKVDIKKSDARFMSAAYFDIERLKAILSVIYRNESTTLSRNNQEFLNLYHDHSEKDLARKEAEFSSFTPNKSVDINIQIGTLLSLGMIGRTYTLDTLSSRVRWKCNLSWDVIRSIAEEIQFPLENYIIDR